MAHRGRRKQNYRPHHVAAQISPPNAAGGRRRFKLTFGVALVCSALMAAWGVWIWQGSGSESGRAVSQDTLRAFTGQDGLLQPAPPGQKTPVNTVDPLSGKPIGAKSPTTTYKGYIVAFCCPQTESYNGGWNRLSEVQKDAFVLKCLKEKGEVSAR